MLFKKILYLFFFINFFFADLLTEPPTNVNDDVANGCIEFMNGTCEKTTANGQVKNRGRKHKNFWQVFRSRFLLFAWNNEFKNAKILGVKGMVGDDLFTLNINHVLLCGNKKKRILKSLENRRVRKAFE